MYIYDEVHYTVNTKAFISKHGKRSMYNICIKYNSWVPAVYTEEKTV